MRTITLKLAALVLIATCGTAASEAAATGLPRGLSNSAAIEAITNLAPPGDGGFSFIVMGDNRGGSNAFTSLTRQINDYVSNHAGPDRPLFILHTGDAVSRGTTKDWDAFAMIRSKLHLPIVFVCGNHDIASSHGSTNFQNRVGAANWAFDFGGCRFIGLDNARGVFSKESVDFLSNSLKSGTGLPGNQGPQQRSWRNAIVVFHEPPAVGRWRVHSMYDDAHGGRGGAVMKLLSAFNVSAVFLGHIHLYDEMQIGGVPYIISGGAGAPLYSRFGFGRAQHGFTVVHVSRAGVSWHWVPLEH